MHLRFAGIRQKQYTDSWTYHLHRESRLITHTDLTPPLQTLFQSPYPLPTYTTATQANTCYPGVKLLNVKITSHIPKHKLTLWKEHLDAHWDHMHNTHILWNTHTRYIQQSISTHPKQFHNIQQQPHPNILRFVSPNTQHTRQTDPITEQNINYKVITSPSPELRSKKQ